MPVLPDLKPGRWGDLRLRASSALVLLPVVLLSEWAGGWAWALLVTLAAAGMAWEWSRLFGGAVVRLPGAAVLAGVWDHSNFRADMHGRLRRTARFIAMTTYGGREEAEGVIGRVRRMLVANRS